ncbi:MAG TPA: glycosyltransferase [Solirubrobacteraceae bacterium]|jgi:glycosyltransferase involved in cell wall biosynthesis|nr:glycosyltransferase [Solirubrobacteraceae bacterium]
MDVLVVSLGSTGGLRTADEELLASLRRAGAEAAIARAAPPRAVRTTMLTDLLWALAARRAAVLELRRTQARALIYSSTTAASFWPRPGAIRFDALSAGNRPGRHGLWQRPLEQRRLREAPLLLPWSDGALPELRPRPHADRTPPPIPSPKPALTLPVAIESSLGSIAPSHATGERDIAAFAYVANPAKKGLDRILDAWRSAGKPGEQLVLAGASERELRAHGYALPARGVRVVPMLPYDEYRALLRRTRAFVCAARREDYGIAQLEALADGCMLVSTPSPGPYVALALARSLDPRLIGEDLAGALRIALDEPAPGYAAHAARALAPFRRVELDRVVAEQLLPRLLA